MILRVGPYLYRVNFIPDYVEHQGTQCLGLCDNDEQVITVSQRVSEAEQIQVLCHEYMEAWLYHFGRSTRDKEDYCDLFGMAMAQFISDLTHQLRVLADPPQDPVAAKQRAARFRSPGFPLNCPPDLLQRLPRLNRMKSVAMVRRLHATKPCDGGAWMVRHYQLL